MQVSVETLDGLTRKMSVEVPAEVVQQAVKQRIKQEAKKTKIQGFRPNSPMQIKEFEKRYGAGVRQQVVGEQVRQNLQQAVTEQGLRLAGSPEIKEINDDAQANLKFVAEFEVLPELKLKDLKGVKITKLTSEVADKQIDETIENLRKQHTEWSKVDRAAKTDDQINLDFTATLDGKSVKNSEAKDYPLVLGSGLMPESFEKELEGKKAGDKFETKIDYPENHPNKDIAGNSVDFAVKVHEVSEPKLPTVDDEFAKKLGVGDATVAGLREEVKKALQDQLDQTLRNLNKQKVVEQVLKANKDVELPQSLVKAELDALHQQAGHHHGPDEKCEEREKLEPEAKRRVSLGLIIGEFARQWNMHSNQESVQKMVQQMAMTSPNPTETLRWYAEDRSRLGPIEWLVLEDQVSERLLESAEVQEKSLSQEELAKEMTKEK
jgi:trigger factor